MYCDQHDKCLNNAMCYLCGNEQRLLKLPKVKTWGKKKGIKQKRLGSALEKSTLKEYKKTVTADKKARLTINSGALWFDTGDISTEMLLLDTKDRAKVTSKGKHSIVIHKEWLEKLSTEAGTKFPCLPFQFKGDTNYYAIMNFNDILEMVQIILMQKGNEDQCT